MLPQRLFIDPRFPAVAAKAKALDLEAAQRFLQRFLEGAPDRHRFADAFHLRRQGRVRFRKFFESETRNLDHAVVDCRLEAGRRFAGDVVRDFVQRVANREFGRDLGDRESGRLGGERARARDARIHLDHDHPPVVGIDRELDVRSAGLDADLANDRERGVAHRLVFPVGKGLGGRDGDRIAGMHAHRIEILDRADDDAVVGPIAHHLHLEFLPA